MSSSGNGPGECLGRQGSSALCSHPKDPGSSNIKALLSPKVVFLNLGSTDFVLGAVLFVVGCLAASLASNH